MEERFEVGASGNIIRDKRLLYSIQVGVGRFCSASMFELNAWTRCNRCLLNGKKSDYIGYQSGFLLQRQI